MTLSWPRREATDQRLLPALSVILSDAPASSRDRTILLTAGEYRPKQRGGSIFIPSIHIYAPLQQHFHHFGPLFHCSPVQGRAPIGVPSVKILAFVKEEIHNFPMSLSAGSYEDRCAVARVLKIDVRLTLQEDLYHLPMAFVGCPTQRCCAVFARVVKSCAMIEKQPDHSGPSSESRPHERRQAQIAAHTDVGATFQEKSGNPEMASPSRGDQGGILARGPTIDIRATFNQQLNNLGVPCNGCFHEGGIAESTAAIHIDSLIESPLDLVQKSRAGIVYKSIFHKQCRIAV